MENSKITAAWARNVASNELGIEAKKQLETCFLRIKEEAQKNNFSASIGLTLNHIAISELESRGFTVKQYDGDLKDPRENGYIIITW